MDFYKENFEKGAEHYINLLNEVKWFDNPYVDREGLINAIKNSTFPPYYGTYLRQLGFLSEDKGEDQLNDVLNSLLKFIPNSNYNINENGITLTIENNEYDISLNIEEFEAGEGKNGFVETIVNEVLDKENLDYRFYNLPPDDETCSFIFVKPEVYKKALEKGLIPEFMGYYAVNY